MPENYTVAWVGDQTREYEAHGPKTEYRIALKDREGTVKLRQSRDTPPPSVGAPLYGDVATETVTPRDPNKESFTVEVFKKAQRDGPQQVGEQALVGRIQEAAREQRAGLPSGQTPVGNPGRADTGSSFDAKGTRIERMAAHKAAATLTATEIGQFSPDEERPSMVTAFKGWCEFLSEDLDAYEAARKAGGGGVPSPPRAGESDTPSAAPSESLEDAVLADDQSVPF